MISEIPRVPLSRKAAFGSGALAEQIQNNALNSLVSPIYNIGLGMSPAMVGVAMAIARLWDAVAGPLIGNMSDNARTRWGRRRPFMLVGGGLSALFFVAIWWVPSSWGQWAMFAYLIFFSILYCAAAVAFQVPWMACGLSMSTDYHERTRIMGVKEFFGSIGGFLPPWLFALTELGHFQNGVEGARYVSIAVGLVIVLFCMIPAIWCDETVAKPRVPQPRVKLTKSVRLTLQNKPFRILTLITLLIVTGLFLVDTLGLYVGIYYVFQGDRHAASIMQGWAGTAFKVCQLASIPLIAIGAESFGKIRTLNACLIVAIIGTGCKWWCYSPTHPWLMLIPSALMGPGLSGLFIISSSMLADVCDLDEIDTGLRREGAFASVYGWFVKIGLSLSLFLSGFILVETGFSEALGSMQSPTTIFWMRFLFSTIPPAALVIAVFLVARFPITEAVARAARKALDSRMPNA